MGLHHLGEGPRGLGEGVTKGAGANLGPEGAAPPSPVHVVAGGPQASRDLAWPWDSAHPYSGLQQPCPLPANCAGPSPHPTLRSGQGEGPSVCLLQSLGKALNFYETQFLQVSNGDNNCKSTHCPGRLSKGQAAAKPHPQRLQQRIGKALPLDQHCPGQAGRPGLSPLPVAGWLLLRTWRRHALPVC